MSVNEAEEWTSQEALQENILTELVYTLEHDFISYKVAQVSFAM
jgi:hypothetical protein